MIPENARILAVGSLFSTPGTLSFIKSIQPLAEILTVIEGTEAIKLSREWHPDIVLIDGLESDVDGLAICRQFRSAHSLGYIPVAFVVSTEVSPEKCRAAVESGVDVLLTEPMNHWIAGTQLELLFRVRKPEETHQKSSDRVARIMAEEKLRHRLVYERCVSRCIQIMMETVSLNDRIDRVLKTLLDTAEVSRTYIFQNEMDSLDSLKTSYRFEACAAGVSPQIDTPELQHLSYSDIGGTLLSKLLKREPYAQVVKDMAGYERELLENQGIQSVLIIPIFSDSELWGFIGFDDCFLDRGWSDDDINVLMSVADNVGLAIHRWQIEKAFIESKARYDSFVNASDDLIFIKDDQLRYLVANEATLRFFQVNSDMLIQKNDFDIMSRDAALECEKSDLMALKSGSISKSEERIGDRHFEVVKFPVELQDNKVGVGAIIRDVTERKLSELDRERLMAAIEQVRETIIITDVMGMIQYVNPVFETITGYTKDEAIGRNPRFLNSGYHDSEFYRDLWDTITSGKTYFGRVINKHKSGKLFTEEATISPVHDKSGSIVNFVAVKRDVSEEILLETQLQQAQKMESVGRLAGGVAHDFNNMLSVILGYSQLVRDQLDDSSSIASDVEEVIKAANRSRDITRQLLAFARKQTIIPVVIDVNDAISNMTSMLHRLIGENIELIWKPCQRLWPVKMDPAQLDQILANICVNARDAISGFGKIIVETGNVVFDAETGRDHPSFNPGDYVLLSISDTGIGMNKKTMQHLFEPFFTTKEVGKGTGLGLATVYGIIKQNGGFISVYSEPGHGTTFKFYIPRYAGPKDDSSAGFSDVPSSGQGETVLVVDDEELIVNLAAKVLKDLNYQVLTATSPNKALAIAERHPGPIDLLLTDVIMPEMNGLDLVNSLKQLYPSLQYVFMSGYTSNVIAHQNVIDNGIQFVQKPFTKHDLAVSIRRALDKESGD